jgi:hypothetical protein
MEEGEAIGSNEECMCLCVNGGLLRAKEGLKEGREFVVGGWWWCVCVSEHVVEAQQGLQAHEECLEGPIMDNGNYEVGVISSACWVGWPRRRSWLLRRNDRMFSASALPPEEAAMVVCLALGTMIPSEQSCVCL